MESKLGYGLEINKNKRKEKVNVPFFSFLSLFVSTLGSYQCRKQKGPRTVELYLTAIPSFHSAIHTHVFTFLCLVTRVSTFILCASKIILLETCTMTYLKYLGIY